MEQLYDDILDGAVTIGHSRQDSYLHYDTVDEKIILGHRRLCSYIRYN